MRITAASRSRHPAVQLTVLGNAVLPERFFPLRRGQWILQHASVAIQRREMPRLLRHVPPREQILDALINGFRAILLRTLMLARNFPPTESSASNFSKKVLQPFAFPTKHILPFALSECRHSRSRGSGHPAATRRVAADRAARKRKCGSRRI